MVAEPTSPRQNMDKTLSPASIGKKSPKKKSSIGLNPLGACLESPPPKKSHCENEGDKASFILQSLILDVLANISQEKTR
jgi:hypothetical protein